MRLAPFCCIAFADDQTNQTQQDFDSSAESIRIVYRQLLSHVSISETEMKLFQPLKEFWNHFSDNEHVAMVLFGHNWFSWNSLYHPRLTYSWAAIILQNNFEIISDKFPVADIWLFQVSVCRFCTTPVNIFVSSSGNPVGSVGPRPEPLLWDEALRKLLYRLLDG